MREIQLTQGKVTMVDDEYYNFLSQWRWCAAKSRNTFYAIRTMITKGVRRTIRMHRLIIGAPIGADVDHKDGDGLNNQSGNLRLCNQQQNQMNQRVNTKTSSIYKGVSWSKHDKVWVSYIYHNYKRRHLGSFVSELSAAKEYNVAALDMFGEFARLNILAEPLKQY